MKTKILYVLVSGPEDVYLEQAYVSALSCVRHNPEATLVLLTDRLTADGWLQEHPLSREFLALFSEVLTVPLDPALSAMQRSRLLKTGMRQHVQGDFLYIDADTIVARSLEDIDTFPDALAAAPDLHCPFAKHPHRQATLNLCKKLGYDASAELYYYNSGVLLVRDRTEARAFFRRWQENYAEGFRRGVRPDQPSLAQSGAGRMFVRLPDVWNCEVQNGVRYLRDAYIVHYMVTNVGSGPQDALYLLNRRDVLLRMREKGTLTDEVRAVMEDPFAGYAPLTQVFSGDDLYLFRTRRYRWLRRHYAPGKFSLLEWLLKVKDHLCRK